MSRIGQACRCVSVLATSMLLALAGCEPADNARPAAADVKPVSEPVPLPSDAPIIVSDLPSEISAPIKAPSNAPLPAEGDTLTSGQVLERLRARLSTPTCIVGPNNTRWRHKYAGYPQHFADEVEATLPMMLVVLDELETHKLPGEFALIPIVESWYRPETHSFGGASGMWQMLAETARNNGATVSGSYDGRLSALDSTDAALNYLGKLQGMFNDWRLTAMAYNSGEYRLMRTMSPDELAARSAGAVHYRRPDGLSTTTYDYVSKMRALTCLLAQPQRQGIPLDPGVPITHWIPYTVPADIASLDELASRLGTDAEQLKDFNHGFHNGRLSGDAPRTVLVPASTRPRWANTGTAMPRTPISQSTTNAVRTFAPPAMVSTPTAISPSTGLSKTATVPAPATTTTSTSPVIVLHKTGVATSTIPATQSPNTIPGPSPTATPVTANAATSAAQITPAPAAPATARADANPAKPSTATLVGIVPPAATRPVATTAESHTTNATTVGSAAATPPSATTLGSTTATAPSATASTTAVANPAPANPAPAAELPATSTRPSTVTTTTIAPVALPSPGTAFPIVPATRAPNAAPVTASVASNASAATTTATGGAPAANTTLTTPTPIQADATAIKLPAPPTRIASPSPAMATTSTSVGNQPSPAIVPPAPMPAMPASVPVSNVPASAVPAPASSSPATPVQGAQQSMEPVVAPRTYKVDLGDTLDTIAQRFNVSVMDLRAWNHLSPDASLYVDQVLKLEP